MKKFTVIDFLIIVAAVAVLAASFVVLKPKLFGNGGDDKVQFTVLVSNTDSGLSEIIKPGDEVSISFSEKAYGTVTGVSEEPYKKSEFNAYLGKYVTQEIDGKSDLKIDIECPAAISDTEIANGEVLIRVGSEMPVRGKGYTVKGYVVDISDGQEG